MPGGYDASFEYDGYETLKWRRHCINAGGKILSLSSWGQTIKGDDIASLERFRGGDAENGDATV
eukprot:scaffold61301_cov45-Attheya_sp.AAC.9